MFYYRIPKNEMHRQVGLKRKRRKVNLKRLKRIVKNKRSKKKRKVKKRKRMKKRKKQARERKRGWLSLKKRRERKKRSVKKSVKRGKSKNDILISYFIGSIILFHIFSFTLNTYPIDDEELMEEEKEKGIKPPTFPDPTPISLDNIPFGSVGDVLMV